MPLNVLGAFSLGDSSSGYTLRAYILVSALTSVSGADPGDQIAVQGDFGGGSTYMAFAVTLIATYAALDAV